MGQLGYSSLSLELTKCQLLKSYKQRIEVMEGTIETKDLVISLLSEVAERKQGKLICLVPNKEMPCAPVYLHNPLKPLIIQLNCK